MAPETEMSDLEISRALDGKLGTHMLNGLFQELVDTHRNHTSRVGYKNLRKLMEALTSATEIDAKDEST